MFPFNRIVEPFQQLPQQPTAWHPLFSPVSTQLTPRPEQLEESARSLMQWAAHLRALAVMAPVLFGPMSPLAIPVQPWLPPVPERPTFVNQHPASQHAHPQSAPQPAVAPTQPAPLQPTPLGLVPGPAPLAPEPLGLQEHAPPALAPPASSPPIPTQQPPASAQPASVGTWRAVDRLPKNLRCSRMRSIPADFASRFVGPDGEILAGVMRATGTRIQIGPLRFRELEITGSQWGVDAADRMITNAILDETTLPTSPLQPAAMESPSPRQRFESAAEALQVRHQAALAAAAGQPAPPLSGSGSAASPAVGGAVAPRSPPRTSGSGASAAPAALAVPRQSALAAAAERPVSLQVGAQRGPVRSHQSPGSAFRPPTSPLTNLRSSGAHFRARTSQDSVSSSPTSTSSANSSESWAASLRTGIPRNLGRLHAPSSRSADLTSPFQRARLSPVAPPDAFGSGAGDYDYTVDADPAIAAPGPSDGRNSGSANQSSGDLEPAVSLASAPEINGPKGRRPPRGNAPKQRQTPPEATEPPAVAAPNGAQRHPYNLRRSTSAQSSGRLESPRSASVLSTQSSVRRH